MIMAVNFGNKSGQMPCCMILRFTFIVKCHVNRSKELTVEAAFAASTVNLQKVIEGFFTVSYQSC